MTVSTFKNHKEAGKMLADKIAAVGPSRPLVLAIPHGGVPIGIEVSNHLEIPLDTIAVQKITAPLNPELVIGAIAGNDIVVIEPYAQDSFDITDKELEEIIAVRKNELQKKVELFKSGSKTKGKSIDTIILVDDGYATGTMLQAAIQSIHKMYKPVHIIFASPIIARDTKAEIEREVHSIICLSELDDLIAINLWYDEVEPISQDEVIEMLAEW